MAAAARKLAVSVLVRDPKTDLPVFLQAGQSLPGAYKALVAEENLKPKRSAGSKKPEPEPLDTPDSVEEAPVEEPAEDVSQEPERPETVEDSELDSGESFDTE